MRKLSLLALFCTLTGCGFEPLYQSSQGVPLSSLDVQNTSQIKISLVPNREGQQLRNNLLDKLNPYGEPSDPLYRLDLKLDTTKTGMSLRRDGTYQRYKLQSIVSYQLFDLAAGKIIYKDAARQSASYLVAGSNAQTTFSATMSERSEIRNLMLAISDDISLSLSSFLKKHAHKFSDSDKSLALRDQKPSFKQG